MSKIFAFYLPQFHRIEQNNEWWGRGFTEWTNVSKARPVYPGHNQPDIPGELGFYDLTNPNSLTEQVNLARKYKIDGFIFYNYWFSGRKLLDKPVDLFTKQEFGFPFAICWANENWTKNWDGGNREVLLEQNYVEGFEKDYLVANLETLRHVDYIKLDDKPMIMIYRPELFPQPRKSIENFRLAAMELGLGPINVVAVSSFGTYDPRHIGVDAVVEFPPLGTHEKAAVKKPRKTLKKFKGHFYDYGLAALHSSNQPEKPFKRYRSVMPGWDNTPRRQMDSTIFLNSNPEVFSLWAASQIAATKTEFQSKDAPIFVNAWNEWAEGAHLEPNRNSGTAYLEAVVRAREIASVKTRNEILHELEFIVMTKYPPAKTIHKQPSLFNSIAKSITLRILREINIQNLTRFFYILRGPNPIKEIAYALKRATKNIRASMRPWKPASYILEVANEIQPKNNFLAFTAHIFYDDYISKVIDAVKENPLINKVFISTPSEKIFRELNAELEEIKIEHEIKLTVNKGRNFGPLFWEFGKDLLDFEYFIHLHSKKSKHTRKDVAKDWSDRFWNQFAHDIGLISRTLSIMEKDKHIGISYPLVSDIIAPMNFAMSSNAPIAAGILAKINLQFDSKRFAYPAGGMFLARTKSLKPLLELKWTADDFPAELSQMDGTTQHALERLVGLVPSLTGFSHLIFDSQENSFTLDESFVEDANLSRKNVSSE